MRTAAPPAHTVRQARPDRLDSTRYPGERLVVCRNPAFADERARKRADLLAATEAELAAIAQATVARTRNRLHGNAEIALAVGGVFSATGCAKHFDLDITETALACSRKQAEIAAEAATDGLYVVRTNVPEGTAVRRPYGPRLQDPGAGRARVPLDSRPSICMCGRSITSASRVCGRTCFCACWPTTSSGTCAKRSSRCCMTMRNWRCGAISVPIR